MAIPKSTVVQFNAEVVHHDELIWPDPYKFDPERFADGNKIHACAFAPFGFGERQCIGYKLALAEMRMNVIGIVSKYQINLIAPHELKLVRCTNFLTIPRDKVILSLQALDNVAN